MWKCESCELTFADPECVNEYVDDSGRPAFQTPVCPYCRSEEIDEMLEEDEEDDSDI